jgi:NAD(P)H-nitrite reductase large subunit
LKLKTGFIIIGDVDGSVAGIEVPCWPRAMTRCECAGMSFDEVARHMKERGLSIDQVAERTGCGRLCTACLPDLRDHLCGPR